VFGQLLCALLILGIPSHARLRVASVPPSLEVWVDGVWRGRSPVWVDDLELGRHVIRIASRQLWTVQPLDTVVVLVPGVNRVTFSVPGAIQIVSESAGAIVMENGREIGHCPLLISRDTTRQRRLSVRVGAMTMHEWDWMPAPGALTRVHIHGRPLDADASQGRGLRRAAVLGAASAAMAVVSAVLAREADEIYEEYGTTANPDRLRTLFGRAQRFDRWASGLWVGFEVSAVTALIWWIAAS